MTSNARANARILGSLRARCYRAHAGRGRRPGHPGLGGTAQAPAGSGAGLTDEERMHEVK
jgi:hypothetical protein